MLLCYGDATFKNGLLVDVPNLAATAEVEETDADGGQGEAPEPDIGVVEVLMLEADIFPFEGVAEAGGVELIECLAERHLVCSYV